VAPVILQEFFERLSATPVVPPDVVAALFRDVRATLKASRGWRGRDVMAPIRVALTGSMQGPCLEVVVCLLGRQRCLDRVARQLDAMRSDGA
jgi:hypothetical protein